MKVSELIEHLSKMNPDHRVVIPLLTSGSIRSEKVEIESVREGMGLDMSTVMVFPTDSLTQLTREEVRDIVKSISMGQSWHHGQIVRKLKAKIHTYCPHCSYALDNEGEQSGK